MRREDTQYMKRRLGLALIAVASTACNVDRPRLTPCTVPSRQDSVGLGEMAPYSALRPVESSASPPSASASSVGESKTDSQSATVHGATPDSDQAPIVAVAYFAPPEMPLPGPEEIQVGVETLSLDDVIGSIYRSYPLLESANWQREIAAGDQTAAAGEFDLKLKAASENGPAGFYRTFRQNVGFVQPLYRGGEAFVGYRVGRGSFQPWYLERQTNEGGEFKAGFVAPLWRDRTIDARRAELWRSNYGRQAVEPDIQAQLIGFVQEGGYAFWKWVAAAAKHRIAARVLELAESRTGRIRRQVEENLLDPLELTDNLRLVAERRAKRADTLRQLQQAGVKLSLYLRDENGEPRVPHPPAAPEFPRPTPLDANQWEFDIQLALEQRPETALLSLMQRQLEVELDQANNLTQPSVNAVVSASKDMGLPTSSKNDKGPLEMDAAVLVDVPIQRRKARGKIQSLTAKLRQLQAKRRLTEDKIVADVQAAYAAWASALEQVAQTEQAVGYSEDLAQRERRNFELGASDLLKVTLREQYAVESAEKAVDALLMYHLARADYRAALAQDR